MIGLGVSWIAGLNGIQWHSFSVFLICAGMAFIVNWLVFVPSALTKSEKFYDLTGAFTYFSVILTAFALSQPLDLRAIIAGGLVLLWGMRLGGFLFLRIRQDGEDRRFREIKENPIRFLAAWTTQGLWVILTAACALANITTTNRQSPDLFLVLGVAIWVFGFAVEVIADRQKRLFRQNPTNKGKFITTGLWAWSQHPNYFGEITLWIGMAVIALPILQGGLWITLISPLFVFLLLTKVSGIPLLDRHAAKAWGDNPEYQEYCRRTSKLILRPPRK